VTKRDPSGWWEAELKGKKGLIPSNFVEEHTPAAPKLLPSLPSSPAQISTKGFPLLHLSQVLSPILFLISPDPGFADRLSDIQLNQATNPIYGLNATKDCGLEEAVKIFQKNSELGKVDMDGMVFLANMAAGNLSSNPHNLSQDEIAAIHLYTQETPLYRVLNDRLRSEKRELLAPFFPYLKLLLRAMYKLPVIKCPVYRGVTKDLSKNFVSGKSYIWWGLTSTAAKIEVRFDMKTTSLHCISSPLF